MKAIIICNFVISGLLLILGLFGILVLPKYVQDGVLKMRRITDSESPMFQTWVDASNSTELLLRVYVYNITNPSDIINKQATPQLESIGPYVYEESLYKDQDSITWFTNGTVQYKYHKKFRFRPDLSGTLRENDKVTTVNFQLISSFHVLNELMPSLQDMKWKNAKSSFEQLEKSIFIMPTVHSLLWELRDPFVTILLGMPESTIPQLLVNDDPQLWNSFSQEYDGLNAHANNMTAADSLGRYVNWAGRDSMGIWKNNYANMINGTSGWIFHTNVQDTDILPVFADQLLRSVNLSHVENRSANGIPMKCFGIEPSQLLSSNPDNAAFDIVEDGIFPLPPAPTLSYSKPFFMDASLKRVNVTVDGHLPPVGDKKKDDTVLCLDPITGLTLEAHRRIQINTILQELHVMEIDATGKVSKTVIEITKGLTTTWIPIVRLEDSAVVKQSAAELLRTKVYSPLFISSFGGIACCVLCGVFLLISILLVISHRRQNKRRSFVHAAFEKDPLINITR